VAALFGGPSYAGVHPPSRRRPPVCPRAPASVCPLWVWSGSAARFAVPKASSAGRR